MKGVILAGGLGRRIKTDANKCLLDLGDTTPLEHNLKRVKDLIKEFYIVVGYGRDQITSYVKELEFDITLVIQEEQLGLVHALECTKGLFEDDLYLMLGDEILINSRHNEMYKFFKTHDLTVACGVLQNDPYEISKTYTVKHDANMNITDLIEKPDKPFSNYQGTGNCMFKHEIYDFIDETPVNPVRREKELVDLIKVAILKNRRVKLFEICDQYCNINTQEDLDRARRLLEWMP